MMRRAILLLLVLPALGESPKQAASFLLRDLKKFDPTVLPDDDHTKELAKPYRALASDTQAKGLLGVKRRILEQRLVRYAEALATIGAKDNAASAKALCAVYVQSSERVEAADAARDQCVVNWKNCVAFHDPEANRNNLKKNTGPTYHLNQVNEKIWRDYAYGMLGLRIDSARLLRSLASDDARKYLATTALTKNKSPELRARLAGILSASAAADPAPFLAALKAERNVGVRAALLTAVSRLDAAQELGKEVAAHLEDRSERVRIAAARALERMHVIEGVEPLVERMAHETGLARTVMARALESMTGQNFGAHPDSWRQWWAAQQGALAGTGLPPRSDSVRRESKDSKGGFFYGIPQVSLKIIYIIDVSGSMKNDIGGKTRLKGCKQELSRAISQLPRTALFNVILYNNTVKTWKKTMVVAGPLKKGKKGNKDEAKKFFEKVPPKGSTNIYDALRMAFKVVGEGATKKGKKLNADTIYLLTDGSPTKPDGKLDDVKKILEGARKWNALGRITIHTIGIGEKLNTPFLQQLAAENNGKFIHKKG